MPSKPSARVRPVPPAAATSTAVDRELRRIARSREGGSQDTEPRGRGVIEMPGRRLADGTRRGAKVARRLTVYLPLEVATELSVRAARRGATLSDVAAEALAEAFGLALESSDGG